MRSRKRNGEMLTVHLYDGICDLDFLESHFSTAAIEEEEVATRNHRERKKSQTELRREREREMGQRREFDSGYWTVVHQLRENVPRKLPPGVGHCDLPAIQ